MTPAFVSGDTNNNSKLDLGETWSTRPAARPSTGNYSNTGTANGSFTDSAGHSRTDTADRHQLLLRRRPADRHQQGHGRRRDHRRRAEHPDRRVDQLAVHGDQRRQRGLSTVTVTDNQAGVTPAYVSGDTNNNSKLDLGETWIYRPAAPPSPAATATPAPPRAPSPTAPATAGPTPRPTPAPTSGPTRPCRSTRPYWSRTTTLQVTSCTTPTS